MFFFLYIKICIYYYYFFFIYILYYCYNRFLYYYGKLLFINRENIVVKKINVYIYIYIYFFFFFSAIYLYSKSIYVDSTGYNLQYLPDLEIFKPSFIIT